MTDESPVESDAAEREERHRVVIIGSGVDGSVTAFRLAEAGIANVVLERGRRWPITPNADTFPAFPSLDRRLPWLDGFHPPSNTGASFWPARIIDAIAAAAFPRSTGLLDVLPHRDMTVVVGAGVGGVLGDAVGDVDAESVHAAFQRHVERPAVTGSDVANSG
ncbi:FAD-dependent monooxygenase [Thermomonospora umbrina]|uniref:FAD binding domain-containing protein n=1 Tax=Thermomonospora umbrina TaxID=111806 RepID=A0A3D9T2U2_9ACTN|nr:FAD-dependent monooxygenase [Thermomonospora umbrina]REF00684.1 FAD binding domain-containing protein [Thermomonospora umbrina]